MDYQVMMKRKVERDLRKLPLWVQKKMALLVVDLREKGPNSPNGKITANSAKPNIIAIWEPLGRLLATSEEHNHH